MKEKFKKYLPVGIILIFSFILYGNTLKNEYSLDDDLVSYNNPTIQKGIGAIPEIFTSFYSQKEGYNYGYRPIVKLTYAIEYQLFGQNPHISHFINILIYAFICILLFYILKRILKRYNALFPVIITALFLAHPIHTEVVCSLKNRDELLSFMGSLLSLLFIIKYIEKQKLTYICWGLFFYLFAYLSKSSALMFLAIFPLVLYFFTDTPPKKIIYVFLSVFIVMILARYGPKLYLPSYERHKLFFENPLFFDKNIWTRSATGFYVLIFYLKLLLYPHPLSFYYGYDMIPIVNWANGWVIFSFIFHLSIFVYAIRRIKEKYILSFAILFYLVTISMFSNIVKPAMGIVAERYIFATSLGFCIVLAYFILRILKVKPDNPHISKTRRYKVFMILIIILIPYCVKTISRTKVWKDYLTLYSDDIKHLTNSAKANALYAGELLKDTRYAILTKSKSNVDVKRDLDLTIKHYKQALKIYPDYFAPLHNLGYIYCTFLKKYKKAIPYLKKSLKINPEHYEGYMNLAFSYEKLNKNNEAIKYYKKAIEIDPQNITAYNYLGHLYHNSGNFSKAVEYNKKIMAIDSLTDIPYINLGKYYLARSDTIRAISYFEKAIEKNPKSYVLCNDLSDYFRAKGNMAKAEYYNNLSSQINGKNAQLH